MREMKRFLTVCLCVMLVTTLMIPETTFASRTAALSSRKNAESVGNMPYTGRKTSKSGAGGGRGARCPGRMPGTAGADGTAPGGFAGVREML